MYYINIDLFYCNSDVFFNVYFLSFESYMYVYIYIEGIIITRIEKDIFKWGNVHAAENNLILIS